MPVKIPVVTEVDVATPADLAAAKQEGLVAAAAALAAVDAENDTTLQAAIVSITGLIETLQQNEAADDAAFAALHDQVAALTPRVAAIEATLADLKRLNQSLGG